MNSLVQIELAAKLHAIEWDTAQIFEAAPPFSHIIFYLFLSYVQLSLPRYFLISLDTVSIVIIFYCFIIVGNFTETISFV